ncbi:unnamed protein product, partial [Brassica napus]
PYSLALPLSTTFMRFVPSVSECRLVFYKCDINSNSLGCFVISSPINSNLTSFYKIFFIVVSGGSNGDGEAEIVATIFDIDAGTVYAFHVNNCSLDAFGTWYLWIYFYNARRCEQIRMRVSEEEHCCCYLL